MLLPIGNTPEKIFIPHKETAAFFILMQDESCSGFLFLWLESNRCFLWQLLILAGQKIGYRHIRKAICFYRIPIGKAHSKDKKTRYYYYCKNTVTPTGHECSFRLNIEHTEINKFVAKIISAMVNDPRFVEEIQAKIGTAVDTEDMEKRIAVLQGQLKQTFGTKSRLERQMDTLDINDAMLQHLVKCGKVLEKDIKMY